MRSCSDRVKQFNPMARTIIVQKNRNDFVVKLDQVRKWKDEESTSASDPAPNAAAVSKSGTFYDPLSSPFSERENSPTTGPFPVNDDINSKIYFWRGTPWSLEVDAVVNSTNEVSLARMASLGVALVRIGMR